MSDSKSSKELLTEVWEWMKAVREDCGSGDGRITGRTQRDGYELIEKVGNAARAAPETEASLADWKAAYNRIALAARAVTAELQQVGDETGWEDGDETDRVYSWAEMRPLAEALDADIHQSRLAEKASGVNPEGCICRYNHPSDPMCPVKTNEDRKNKIATARLEELRIASPRTPVPPTWRCSNCKAENHEQYTACCTCADLRPTPNGNER